MSRRKGRVVCIGSCAAGHVTQATSEEGRTTWNGTCTHDGCELPVFARRAPRQSEHSVKPEAIEPAGATKPAGDPEHPTDPSGAAAGKPGSRVVRVEGWSSERDERKPATQRRGRAARATSGTASAAAGSGTKAPGRGKRTAGQRADDGGGAGKRGGAGRGRPAGGEGAGGEAKEDPPAQGRGRRLIGRARASFSGGADDEADGPAYDFY